MTENYEEKIRELEEQIKQLSEQLSSLIETKNKQNFDEIQRSGIKASKENLKDEEHLEAQGLPYPCSPDRRRILEAIGNIKKYVGKNLERKIGLEWITEVSAVLVMTTFVLTSRATFFSEFFPLWGRIIILYGISIGFILLELFTKRKSILFDTIASCGLAGIPYATYALFFLKEIRPFTTTSYSIHSLGIIFCVIVLSELPLILVSHKRKNSTIAGIGFFLNYYTIAISCYGTPDLFHLTYALITSLFIAIVTFIFHILHKWFFLSWGGVIASYLTYGYVFIYLNPHTYLNIPEKPYFWISFTFLSISFLIFSATAIVEAKRKNEYRRGIAPLVGLNSLIYFALSFYIIRTNYLEYEYIFRTVFTFFLLIFAIVSNIVGEKYNYIFKIYAIKTFIMATLALQAYFSGEKLLIAFSIECLALFLAHKRSGYEIYKWMNLFLLILTFFWGLAYLNVTGTVYILQHKIPIKWFSIVTTAGVLNLVGTLYEHFGTQKPLHPSNPQEYEVLPSFYLSMLHAFIGSLLLLLITLSQYIEDAKLPFILMFQFLIVFGFGYLTSTQALEFSSATLLLSSQITYLLNSYYFQLPLFENNYLLALSFLLAFLSFLGSCIFERFSYSIVGSSNDILHFLPTITLYSISIIILATTLFNTLPIDLFLNVLTISGLTLYLLGYAYNYPVMGTAGYSSITISGLSFLYFTQKIKPHPFPWEFIIPLSIISLSLVFIERITLVQVKKMALSKRLGKIIRISAVVLNLLTLTLYGYSTLPKEILIFYWLLIATILMLTGIFIQESLYRWAGLLVILITILRVFFVFNYISSEIYRILNFAVSSAVLFAIGWLYTKTEDTEKNE